MRNEDFTYREIFISQLFPIMSAHTRYTYSSWKQKENSDEQSLFIMLSIEIYINFLLF